jgi:hypothetical protein
MPATSKLVSTGRVISGLAVAFLLMDGAMKLWKPPAVLEATRQLGFPESGIVGIGVLLLACTLLHTVPRTAILGAVLLTGYLGGAVATQLRAGNGWFNILFPVIIGTLVWLGFWLRDPRARNVFS